MDAFAYEISVTKSAIENKLTFYKLLEIDI